jgi:hypothetical protein
MAMSDEFLNPLPGVPAIESPFFEKLFPPGKYSEEVMRVALDLREKGYAVIDFPDEEFDSVADKIKENLRDRYDWNHWQARGYNEGQGLRIQDAWTFDKNVRRLATNQKIIALLTTLFGRQAWPFQTLNFPVGTQQHFHTDSVHFSSVPERFMCGVWTALEDISSDAGPLCYFPGSHKWPIYTNEHIGVNASEMEQNITQGLYEPLWRGLVEASGVKEERFVAKKGQSLIWLSNLLHGGYKQADPNLTRWSQVTHYYFEDCAFYTPMTSDPFYGTIAFRSVVDLITGKLVENKYVGSPIPEEFIRATRTKPKKLPKEFDSKAYLRLNPDVAAAGVDAVAHYMGTGWREGRKYK